MFRIFLDYFFGLEDDEELDPTSIVILTLFVVALLFGLLTIITIRGWG